MPGDLIDPYGKRLIGGGLNGGVEDVLLDLRGAQPLLLCVVERDGSMTWMAPDTMSDRHLEKLTASFFQWKAEYKAKRSQRIPTDG